MIYTFPVTPSPLLLVIGDQNGLWQASGVGPPPGLQETIADPKGTNCEVPEARAVTPDLENVVSRIYRLFIYIYIYPWKAFSLSLSLFLGEVSPVHVISPKRLFCNCIHLILGKSSVVQYCNSPRHMMRSPHLSLYLHLYLYPICTHI